MKKRLLSVIMATAVLLNTNITTLMSNAKNDASVMKNSATEVSQEKDISAEEVQISELTEAEAIGIVKSVTGNNVAQVVLNGLMSAAITENGDLYCWGYNSYGQVGNGTTTNQTKPVKVLSQVKMVALGNYHSAAITENGDLYCWGYNSYRQVGNGTNTHQTSPVKVLSQVKSVALGEEHSAAIKENGDLYCWGNNFYGQVGNGTDDDVDKPVKVLSQVKMVALGSYYSAAIKENGDLYCWGKNYYGQVGNGTTTDQTKPVKVLDKVKTVALNIDLFSHSAAIKENGDLYCWGYNSYGEIGNGTTTTQTKPVKVLEQVKIIALGSYHSAAVKENGDLYCWGSNANGQIGNGTTMYQTKPVKILDQVRMVDLGSSHSAAVKENGELYCWGSNGNGQVGNGGQGGSREPEKILDKVKTVVMLSNYFFTERSAAITEDGELYCWGGNDKGQIGNGTTETVLTPVRIMSVGSFKSDSASTSPSPSPSPSTAKVAKVTLDKVKISNKKAVLTWKKTTDVNGYEVYMSKMEHGTYKKIKTITSASTTKYTTGTLANNTTYYFKVRAYKNVSGKKVYGDFSAFRSVARGKVEVKTATLKSTTIKNNKAVLTWARQDSVSGYIIYMAKNKNSGYKAIKTIKKSATTKYTSGTLAKNTTYYFKIRPYKNVSGKKVYGGYSEIISVRRTK